MEKKRIKDLQWSSPNPELGSIQILWQDPKTAVHKQMSVINACNELKQCCKDDQARNVPR